MKLYPLYEYIIVPLPLNLVPITVKIKKMYSSLYCYAYLVFNQCFNYFGKLYIPDETYVYIHRYDLHIACLDHFTTNFYQTIHIYFCYICYIFISTCYLLLIHSH